MANPSEILNPFSSPLFLLLLPPLLLRLPLVLQLLENLLLLVALKFVTALALLLEVNLEWKS